MSDEREVREMAEPETKEAARKGRDAVSGLPAGTSPSLVAALIVTVIGVVGEILIHAVPGAGWMQANDELVITLGVIVQTLIYIGVVWLGVLLAYRGIVRGR